MDELPGPPRGWGEHLDDPLPIATLAAGVHLSPSRFAHLFRRHVGTSPAHYLHALRMQRARLTLEQTFLSVKEVMSLVGCNDASHFSRDFRRFHGITPRACRVAATGRSTRRVEGEREVRRGQGQPLGVQHVCDLLLGARLVEPEVSDLQRAVAALLATLDLVKSTAGLANEQQDAP